MARIQVWDLPIRLFHAALVLGVGACFITEQLGKLEWHSIAGRAVLGLLVFRILWGFVGSHYARFSQFVRGQSAIRAYLAGQWQQHGHNPLGAWSVVAMLLVLLVQAISGLFANDDSTFYSPLADLVSRASSDWARVLHHYLSWGVIGLVVLHIVAIIWYVRVKGQNLVKPMLTGWQDGEPELNSVKTTGGYLALLIAILLAGIAIYLASGTWISQVKPTIPVNQPPPPAW